MVQPQRQGPGASSEADVSCKTADAARAAGSVVRDVFQAVQCPPAARSTSQRLDGLKVKKTVAERT